MTGHRSAGSPADAPAAGEIAVRAEREIAVRAEHLTCRYGHHTVLDDVNFDLTAGSITGLLGRNGSGKTTLMRLMAAQEFATAGRVEVFGRWPMENRDVQRRVALIREDQVYPDIRVRHAVAAAGWCYPNWDDRLAAELLAGFDLPPSRPIKKLSRGMRSAVGIVIGLASRADLTLLDEPYAGLDPVSRRVFYDQLLADYAEHPRTILLSTHLVDEVADLLEHVLVIDRGRITLDASADQLRGSAATVSGPRQAAAAFTAGRVVWQASSLGAHARSTVAGPLSDTDRSGARAAGLAVEPVSLQQLLVDGASRIAEEVSA
jgi:ABC-2 type transport system ATP-binding protein